jgi:glycine/D-amino acid oxidase-like deaminating enzyme/nitrite reductase/ring-hydroxylating ferredoxin subunit
MPLPAEFRSVWTYEAAPYPTLEENLNAEVVVVGAGIVGLTTALSLAQSGLDVAVVEALSVGRQVTGGSTAKVTAQHGLIYGHLARTRGPAVARLYGEANRAGMARIKQWTDELGIACDLETRTAYLYSEATGREDLIAEAEAARAAGFEAAFLERAPLSFETTGAMSFPDQAQFNPVRYLDGLAKAFVSRGGRLFENSRVRDIEDANRWRIKTDGGSIEAKHIVVATNMTIKSPLGMSKRTQPRMHTAMAFRIGEEPFDGMFLGVDDPTHSLRTGRLGSGRVLVALGPKFNTGHEADVAGRFADLAVWVKERFGDLETAAAWCNEDYDTPDRVPFIGEPDPKEAAGFYIATGFNAWGISNGTAGGILLADLIAGHRNEWRELYEPARPADEINEGGESATLVSSISQIAPGEGAVLDGPGKKIAVWRDHSGATHKLSAECTHKGCIVSWNNAAKMWNCPCHGSMFTREGKVLHGPARKDLEARN